jgi:hypothetical protein
LSGDLPAVLRAVDTAIPACRFLSKPVDTTALIESINELSSESWNSHIADTAATRAL